MSDPLTTNRLSSVPRREFLGHVAVAGAALAISQVTRPLRAAERDVTAAAFRGRAGENFRLCGESDQVAVQLRRVDEPAADPGRPSHVRQNPFLLIFNAPPGTEFKDQICYIEHPRLGQIPAFVSRVGPRKRQVHLQAVFG